MNFPLRFLAKDCRYKDPASGTELKQGRKLQNFSQKHRHLHQFSKDYLVYNMEHLLLDETLKFLEKKEIYSFHLQKSVVH